MSDKSDNETINFLRAEIERISLENRALAENERRLHSMLEKIPESFQSLDVNGNLLRVNEKWCEELGYTKEEVIGRAFDNFLTPASHKRYVKNFPKFKTNGHTSNVEFEMLRKDKKEITVSYDGVILYDDKGEMLQTACVFTNITEQNKIKNSLEIEKHRFEMAEKIANLGSWEQNFVHDTLDWSDEVHKIFEIDISVKMTFDHFIERVHPEDRESVNQAFQASVRDHKPYHLNHRLLLPDGRIKHILEHAKHFYDSSNNHIYTIGTVQDITEQTRLQEELAETNTQLTRISENIPGVIYTFQLFSDGRSCFPFASEHFYEMYGVTPKEIKDDSTKLFAVIHPEDLEYVSKKIQTSFEKLTLWEDEYRIIHPDKGIIWLKGMSKPEKQLDGSVLWHGYIHDVTKEKVSEDEIIRLKELYNNIIDSVENLIFVKDVNSVYITCNRAYARFLGVSKEEIIGKSDYDFYDKELSEWFRDHDKKMLESQETTANFEWVNDVNGKMYYYLTTKSPLLDVEGNILGIVGNSADFAERQQLLEQLEDSQSLAKVGSWEYDFIEDKVTASDEQLRIHGFNNFNMELQKDTFFNLCHPDDVQIIKGTFIDAVNTKETRVSQNRIIRKNDGAIRYLEHRWKTEYENGVAVRTVGMTQDITERKEADNLLRKNEEMLSLIIDKSPVGICTVDLLGNFVSTNPTYEKMIGYSKKELSKLSFFDITHPDYRPKNKELFQKMFSLESAGFSFEKIYICKDGKEIDVNVHATGISDETGNIKFGTAFVEDITVKKHANDIVRQKKQELEAMFNEAPNPMAIHNEDGKIVMINKVWEELTGYKHSEIDTIKKWIRKVAPESPTPRKEHIEKMHGITERVDEGEFKIRTKSGEEIIWNFSSAPLGIIDGKRTLISTAMDITELTKKDEMIIAQSRLAAMGEMIGMIAHQWRQPLTVISMDANNMILDIRLDELDINSVEKYSDDILTQTQHLSKTIDDFRNFFKPDKSASKVIVQEVLEETYIIVKDSLAHNNITLETSYASESEVDAYSRELMQVFVNIITNAKDSLVQNKSKNACINIKVFEDDEAVITEISDNGTGIDKAILSKVFDPYFTTKDEKTGTGLGLYMSKMIIEDHLHGKIEAYNQDVGACFRVKLYKQKAR